MSLPHHLQLNHSNHKEHQRSKIWYLR